MERFDTLDQFHAWYEHWHRYHWIAPLIKNKNIADIACGEGYGSALISTMASHVTAVDIDKNVISEAKEKYSELKNISFQSKSALKTDIKEKSLDTVVSFETLEHLEEHEALLHEFKRILKSNGTLIISTPDKLVYSGDGDHNEYHVKELTEHEFKTLVQQYFKHVLFFGQDMQTVSCITPQATINNSAAELNYCQKNNESELTNKNQKPTYLIAIASDQEAELTPFKTVSYTHLTLPTKA